MNNIPEYKICNGTNSSLSDAVSKELRDGWRICGSAVIDRSGYMSQPMIRGADCLEEFFAVHPDIKVKYEQFLVMRKMSE